MTEPATISGTVGLRARIEQDGGVRRLCFTIRMQQGEREAIAPVIVEGSHALELAAALTIGAEVSATGRPSRNDDGWPVFIATHVVVDSHGTAPLPVRIPRDPSERRAPPPPAGGGYRSRRRRGRRA